MKKSVHIIGNRPQFIKAAPIIDELRQQGRELPVIVNTDQHYSDELSKIIFNDLGLPAPKYSLKCGGSSHAKMTANIMSSLEDVLIEIDPLSAVVYGDTNTTLAAALTARKMNIPVEHIEAGPRIYDLSTPEEVNRLCVDHISSHNFAPDRPAYNNLLKEGLADSAICSGDIMYDLLLKTLKDDQTLLASLPIEVNINSGYLLMTCHRPNHTDSVEMLRNIISLIKSLPFPVVFPMHPRTKNCFVKAHLYHELTSLVNLQILPAQDYTSVIALMRFARGVITDSGGLQKEAVLSGKHTLVTFYASPWPQFEKVGHHKLLNIIQKYDQDKVEEVIEFFENSSDAKICQELHDSFGGGRAASRIVSFLF